MTGLGDEIPIYKQMDREDKQDATYDFIAEIYAETGIPATIRQIATHFGITSNGAMRRVDTLIKYGRLRRAFAEEGGRAHFIPFVPVGYCPCCALPKTRK